MPKNLLTTREGELLPNDPLNHIFEFLDPDTFFKVVKELRDYNKRYLLAHIDMLLHWLKNSPVEQQLMSPPLFDNKALSLMLDHYLKQTKRQLGIEALSKRWGEGFEHMMDHYGIQQIKMEYFGLQQIIDSDNSRSFHKYIKQKIVSDFCTPFYLNNNYPAFAKLEKYKLFQSDKLGNIKKVFCHNGPHYGYYRYFVLTHNDTVYGWDDDPYGGAPDDIKIQGNIRKPTLLKSLSYKGITNIVGNSSVNFAFTHDHKIYGWGYTMLNNHHDVIAKEPVLLESVMRKNIVKIICVDRIYYGLTTTGKLYNWGYGRKFGHDQNIDQKIEVLEPTLIKNLASEEIIDIISIICYDAGRIFAITKSGNVYGWGNNTHGGLGLGILKPYISLPTRISALNNVIEIVPSDAYWKSDSEHLTFFALTRSGEIYAWGEK